MPKHLHTRLVLAILLATLITTLSSASAADVSTSDESFRELYPRWEQLLTRRRALQRKFITAKQAQRQVIGPELKTTHAEAIKLLPQIHQAALKELEHTSSGTDPRAKNFLITMVAELTAQDRYEDAHQLATTLIAHDIKSPAFFEVAGIAAFGSHDFTTSERLLKQIADNQKASTRAKRFLAASQDLAKNWKTELQLRAQEKTADDLPRVKLHTSQGDVVVELFENEAPQTVGNFVQLVDKGFYNGLSFHRVLPGYLVQGGCPKGNGLGGPGYTIYCECDKPNYRHHFRGSLAMAISTHNTGGSQFYFTIVPTPRLDGKSTVFGRIIEGLDVLAKLQRRSTTQLKYDPEIPKDKILEATVLRRRDHAYGPSKVQ